MGKELINIIEGYQYVSFDIFDTLIERECGSSVNVHKWVGLIAEQNNIISDIDFFSTRMMAQEKARKKKKGEISLNDIYNEINCIDETKKKELYNLEICIEKEVCTKKRNIFEIYQKCVRDNKHIILTSDMYLPKNVIVEILKENDIYEYNKLYLSFSYNATKSSGKLYSIVLDELKISGSEIIHIGDNFKSDYLLAKKNGLNAYYLRKKKRNSSNGIFTDYYLKKKCQECTINEPLFDFGVMLLGPLLFGFNNWLDNKIRQDKIKKVFFLSREGKLLESSYSTFKYGKKKVECHYLYVSRKSVISSGLTEVDSFEDINKMLSLRVNDTIEGFLDNIDMLGCPWISDLKTFNLIVSDSYKQTRFRDFINTHIYDIQKESLSKKKLLVEYLIQNDFIGDIAIVDVGWKGTMQDSLMNLFKDSSSMNIKGYYLGVRRQCENRKNKFGYIYNPESKNFLEGKCRAMNGLIEQLFSANHGTTCGYTRENGRVQPVLESVEYTTDMIKDFIQVQNGALLCNKKLSNSLLSMGSILPSNVYYTNFINYGIYPKRKDILLFKNFEGKNIKLNKLIYSEPLYLYLFHPSKFKEDFLNSGWKIGFLKMNLRLKLPYFSMFLFLQKNKNRL